ncbi:glycosyltransferase [Anoxybacillus rupiensis]|uniref:Glycosyltransferase n=2 Tax=Anoxybacteroides rupiense TaxID=311460 RepID=A0ABT5W8R2_9BACL|nr:glycosyltransferase [Anoxybacillus rupiensis]
MNDKKIAFIYCVNNRDLYEESVRYVKSLHVPDGYEIEFIAIEGAQSITSGYNQAMKQTDAKYKVYLHQDVYINNKNFISDIMNIFKQDTQIGLIGMIGAKVIPTNGIWWESNNKYGKVYDSHTGRMGLLSFKEIRNSFESVQAVDGLMMITQYDIKWREDIFNGWHFYDISQSVEFLKKGYKVVIPRQQEPWCTHDCGVVNIKNGYEHYRKNFLEEYSGFLFPLVSILIPTYNRPSMLMEALESALKQTYKNIEIIICDDSTNEETRLMIDFLLEKQRVKNVKYIKNKKKLGKRTGLENAQKCFELANGEFINFLLDDDKFTPDKISKMVNYYLQFDNISLVTSYRQTINEKGELLNPIRSTEKLFEKDSFIDGKELGRYILFNMLNVIGEFTTVLFRKKDITGPLGNYLGRQYAPLSDVSTWLHLLDKGQAVYIAEPLSYFRLHVGQNAHDIINIINGAVEWYKLINDSYHQTDYISDLSDFREILTSWLEQNIHITKKIQKLLLDKEFAMLNNIIINQFYDCLEDCIKSIKGIS